MTHEELKELALSIVAEGSKEYEKVSSTLTEEEKEKLCLILLEKNAKAIEELKETLKEARAEIAATKEVRAQAEALIARL